MKEALMEMMKTKNDVNYTQRLWHESVVQKFSTRFPTNAKQFYQWDSDVERFISENIVGLPEELLFQRVTGKNNMTKAQSNAWRLYKDAAYRKYLDENKDTVQESVAVQSKFFREKMDNLTELSKFAIDQIDVTPDIELFRTQLGYFQAGDNENPKQTLIKFQGYVFELKKLTEKLNKVLKNKVRAIAPLDIKKVG